jgi:hypothetical protein
VNPLRLTALIRAVAAEAAEVVAIVLANSVVHDRFTGTAVLDHEQALSLGTLGYVARGSGVDADARRDHPFVDLGESFGVVVENGGDVMARYLVRARELAVSAALVEDLAARLAERPGERTSVTTHAAGAGLGIVEAWRGALVHRVELDATGALSRVKIVDPSFLNWPALPVSLTDTIVPDFPLANKSFNQSYAGNDLWRRRASARNPLLSRALRARAPAGPRRAAERGREPDHEAEVVPVAAVVHLVHVHVVVEQRHDERDRGDGAMPQTEPETGLIRTSGSRDGVSTGRARRKSKDADDDEHGRQDA